MYAEWPIYAWRDPVRIVDPLLDMPPIDFSDGIGSLFSLATRLVGRGRGISLADIPGLYELMTAPAAQVLPMSTFNHSGHSE